MPETVFQQQDNIFQDYSDNTDLLQSEVTWNEMNQSPAITIEQQSGRDGMLRFGPPPPTNPVPISDSIVLQLVMVAGLFVLKYINRLTRSKRANNTNGN